LRIWPTSSVPSRVFARTQTPANVSHGFISLPSNIVSLADSTTFTRFSTAPARAPTCFDMSRRCSRSRVDETFKIKWGENMATINDVWTAYEEARSTWSGCNWTTHYGNLGLDLKGLSSGEAHRVADRWR